MIVTPLRNHELGRKATQIAINHADLTELVNDTAQVFDILGLLPTRSIVDSVALDVPTGLEDISDAAFNDITVQAGDSGDPDATLPVTQIAENNGSTVYANHNNTGKSYSAADSFLITVTPAGGKALNDIDKGNILLLVNFHDAKEFGEAAKLPPS